MKFTHSWWLGALCGVVFLANPLCAQEDKDAIQPGKGIGQIRLGMDGERLDHLLGKPSESDATMGRASESWYAIKDGRNDETTVHTHRDESGKHWFVKQILVTSTFFRTPGGHSTRSTLAELWQEFPDLRYHSSGDGQDRSHLQMYDCPSLGIGIVVEPVGFIPNGGEWGHCRGIFVHDAGSEPIFERLGIAAKKTGSG